MAVTRKRPAEEDCTPGSMLSCVLDRPQEKRPRVAANAAPRPGLLLVVAKVPVPPQLQVLAALVEYEQYACRSTGVPSVSVVIGQERVLSPDLVGTSDRKPPPS